MKVTEQTIDRIANQAGVDKRISKSTDNKKIQFNNQERKMIYQNNLEFQIKLQNFFAKIRECVINRNSDDNLMRYIKDKQKQMSFKELFMIYAKSNNLISSQRKFSKEEQKILKDSQKQKKNQQGDQLLVDLNHFTTFMQQIGINDKKEVEIIFQNCCQQPLPYFKDDDQNDQYLSKNSLKLSMKSFIYNYEQIIKNEIKIKDIINQNKAMQRNQQLSNYLFQSIKKTYEQKQSLKSQFEEFQKCLNIIDQLRQTFQNEQQTQQDYEKTILRRDTYMLNTEEKEERKYAQQLKEAQVENIEKNNRQIDQIIDFIQNQVSERNNLLFEKTQLTYFISYCLLINNQVNATEEQVQTILNYNSSQLYDKISQVKVIKSIDTIKLKEIFNIFFEMLQLKQQIIQIFINDFLNYKHQVNETTFSLLEAGDFLHKKKCSKHQVCVLAQFLKKFKNKYIEHHNKSTNNFELIDTQDLNGDFQFNVDFLINVYNTQENKINYYQLIVQNFINKIDEIIFEYQQKDKPKVQQIIKIHHQNVLIVYIQKYFQQLDKKLDDLIININRIVSYIIVNKNFMDLRDIQQVVLDEDGIKQAEIQFGFQLDKQKLQQIANDNQKSCFKKQGTKSKQKISFYDKDKFDQSMNEQIKMNEQNKMYDQEHSNVIDILNKVENEKQNNNPFNNQTLNKKIRDIDDKDLIEEKELRSFFIQNSKKNNDINTIESQYNNSSLVPKINSKNLDLTYLHHSKYNLQNFDNEQQSDEEQHQISKKNNEYNQYEVFVNSNLYLTDYNKLMNGVEYIKTNKSQQKQGQSEVFQQDKQIKDSMKQSQLIMSQKIQTFQKNNQFQQNMNKNLSFLKFEIDNNYLKNNKVNINKSLLKSDSFLDYQSMMPLQYYNLIMERKDNFDHQWHIRPHHIETLTQQYISKNDNIMDNNYQSYVGKINDQKISEPYDSNIKAKEEIIDELQKQMHLLKQELEVQKANHLVYQSSIQKQKYDQQIIANNTLDKQDYLKYLENSKNQGLHLNSYQSVLTCLREREKKILNEKRENEKMMYGRPDFKWYEKNDTDFNPNIRRNIIHNGKNQNQYKQLADRLQVEKLY